MLTEFQLTNFKSFAGPETIPIRPLTLIFGPNSSGKSSIFQCLLMLKQTIEFAGTTTNLLVKGDLVDLGSYREFIHLHKLERSFSFRAMITAKSSMPNIEDTLLSGYGIENHFHDVMNRLLTRFNKLGLNIAFSYDNIKKYINISCINIFALYGGNNLYPLYDWPYKSRILSDIDLNDFPGTYSDFLGQNKNKSMHLNREALAKSAKRSNVTESSYNLVLDHFLPLHDDERFCYDYFGAEVINDSDLEDVLIPCTGLGLERALRSIIYIGPMREYPERYFSFSGNQTDYVGISGKFVPDVLIVNRNLLDAVNKWFDRLELGYELKVASLQDIDSDVQELFALRLLSKSSGVHVGITDVGFGISQILPVIVQSVISKSKTILIEQPEYHLHPRLQAELGDMFIEAALGERRNTFLIETHSEHLILRILRRIRETAEGTLAEGLTRIKPEDVAVIYVQPGETGSKIISIPINEEGEFEKPWPEGFFSERVKELF